MASCRVVRGSGAAPSRAAFSGAGVEEGEEDGALVRGGEAALVEELEDAVGEGEGGVGVGVEEQCGSLAVGPRKCQALEAVVRGAVGTGSGDDVDVDSAVRLRSFAFLESKRTLYPDALPRRVLQDGFEFEGRRVPLVGPQGIFRPAVCRLPLTI